MYNGEKLHEIEIETTPGMVLKSVTHKKKNTFLYRFKKVIAS